MKKTQKLTSFLLVIILLALPLMACSRNNVEESMGPSETGAGPTGAAPSASSAPSQSASPSAPERVPGPVDGNLAAMGTISGTESYFKPETLLFLTDGDDETFWELSSGDAATAFKPVWVTVDMGDLFMLSRYAVRLAGAAGLDSSLNLCDFLIQCSTDGVTYRNLHTLSGNTGDEVDIGTGAFARYFRIWITKATSDEGDGIARIASIEIEGVVPRPGLDINIAGIVIRDLPEPANRIVETINPTEDLVFATYIATDAPYSIDNTGVEDVTSKLQRALEDCGMRGGGVVYLPAGKYRLTKSIVIPSHVTLRGDWKDPDTMKPGDGDYGTIIIADVASTESEFPGLIRMAGSTGLKCVTIFYPNQSVDNIQPYPWTIELPGSAMGDGAWMAQTIMHVTLLNSYYGLAASLTSNTRTGNHEIHYINNVKGTVLKKGMHVQNCSDTGRTRDVTLNNSYWVNAGAAFNAPDAGKLLQHTLANTTGMAYGDTEWENMYNVRISDMNIGFLVTQGPRIGALMEIFGLHVDNCMTALKVEAVDERCGIEFANSSFRTVDHPDAIALHITEDKIGSSLYNNCVFEARGGRLVLLESNHFANFQNCHFGAFGASSGVEVTNRGRLIVEGSDFSQSASPAHVSINVQASARALVVNAVRFSGSEDDFLRNECSSSAVDFSGWDTFPRTPVVDHLKFDGNIKPAGTNLIIATEAPYNVPADGGTDAVPALQKALDDMAALGGGVVYLPPGHYRLHIPLVVPAGVELRGVDESHHRGESRGTNFFVSGGHATNTPDSDPATITLKQGAGLRGVTFFYPLMPNATYKDYVAYPWAVRGDGSDIYIIDVTFLGAYKAIDLSGDYSAPCDRHFVRYAAGCALKDGVRVGKSSVGWLEDCNWNPNYWCRTDLPNRVNEGRYWQDVGIFIAENLTMLALGACENENVLNFAMYGAQTAYRMYAQDGVGPNATLINVPADGVSGNIIVEATGPKGVNITNTVLCVLYSSKPTNDGIEVRGGKLGVYNMLGLGMKDYNIRITGGDSVFQGACFYEKRIIATGGRSFLSGIILKENMRGGEIYDDTMITLLSNIRLVMSS